MSSRSSGWTRRGARSGAEVGIDTASTALKRSFIGDERVRSQVKVIDGSRAAHSGASVETEDILLLAPLLRFACDLDHGTRKELVLDEKDDRHDEKAENGSHWNRSLL